MVSHYKLVYYTLISNFLQLLVVYRPLFTFASWCQVDSFFDDDDAWWWCTEENNLLDTLSTLVPYFPRKDMQPVQSKWNYETRVIDSAWQI